MFKLNILLGLLGLLASVLAHAEKPQPVPTRACKGYDTRWYVGKTVMDSLGYVGTVTALGRNVVEVYYSDPFRGTLTQSPYELFSEVESCGKFSRGDLVMDQSLYIGRIVHLFSNARAKIEYPEFIGWWGKNISELTPRSPTRCYANICEGNYIVDSNGYRGVAELVFSNGRVKVTYPGYLGWWGKWTSELRLF